ncbi:MAG: hypothetical protein ACRD0Q_09375, partial [Acidimicrobiales bacterium]
MTRTTTWGRAPGLMAALIVLGGLAGCSGGDDGRAARLAAASGAVEVRSDGVRRAVTGSRDLAIGDRVTVTDGSASVRLGPSHNVELRGGSDVEVVQFAGAAAVRLLAGDVLVTGGSRPTTVTADNVRADVVGVARMSKRSGLLVAAYEGVTEAGAGGASVPIPALRQLAFGPDGAAPAGPVPLVYSAADPWDQRLLTDAIELGAQLSARSRGFTAQTRAGVTPGADLFRRVLPGLAEMQSLDAWLGDGTRAPGETLVGSVIALQGRKGALGDRWSSVFGFRDAGAEWGLVALDQQVPRGPLLDEIDAAIGRAPARFGSPGGSAAGGGSGGGGGVT